MTLKYLKKEIINLGGTLTLVSAGLMTAGVALAGHSPLVVNLSETSSVEGQWHNGEVGTSREFLGIPYAQPPVGKLRFKAPKPAELTGHLVATVHGASCIQNPGALSATGPLSEDCLTLNVYTPDGADKKAKLPVMVFIHGGAFVAGGSNQYDGARLANEYGVVVVTLNYRLGALGFATRSGENKSGNMGLKDQKLAMKWVKQNIKAFGGDKKNVTLFGESAGSMSTCVHMVSPGSQNLADKFIMQSAVCVGGLPVYSKEEADAVSAALANHFCPDEAKQKACLKQVPAEALVAWGADLGLSGAGWGPTVVPNSKILPAAPVDLILSGQYNKGPIILGTNKYEWGLFQATGAAPSVSTIAEFNGLIDVTYPAELAPYLKALYAPGIDQLANVKLIEMVTDQVFRCPTRQLARMTSAMGSDVWLYSFEEGQAAHAMELPYVFGNPSPILAPVLVEPLRETIQSFWSTFAHNSSPNLLSQPYWPGYNMGGDMHMTLQESSVPSFGLAKGTCDFWDSLAALPQ